MKGGKTRKIHKVLKEKKVKTSILTIPELRKAFDHMDKVVESLRTVHKHSFSDAVILYREEWRKTFKRDISPADASAYLKFRFQTKTKKTRRAKLRGGGTPLGGTPLGGTPLGGAPLDYSLRPGVPSGVYGNFPSYQTQGLDRYYASAISADCGKPNGFSTDGSAAQQGGVRLIESSVPPSMAYQAQMTQMGQGPFPTSDPVGYGALRTIPASYVPATGLAAAARTYPSDVWTGT